MSIDEIKKLSREKKILLVQEIWDDLEKESIPLSEAVQQELENRLALHKKGQMKYISLEESRLRNTDKRNGL
ncbi:addiction module protein [Sediminicola luteus]|uniref:Addiction module protein n=1 Tax=Sediminicola luteus TaxID=319238 RepID=A0A2A4GAK6_9FLAO|nr:addiction module protein [Sediminicola luteus]PCE65989.1 hypothetical protein B7P33_01420 [Sediminicola luteus]